jgi:hypothetical protein
MVTIGALWSVRIYSSNGLRSDDGSASRTYELNGRMEPIARPASAGPSPLLAGTSGADPC